MKVLRLRPTISVAIVIAFFTLSAPAHAESAVLQPFKAGSGDSCRYGYTEGYLNWRYPEHVLAVDIRGTLADRPITSDSVLCRDDRYYSVATFVAYRSHTVVDEEQRLADNQEVSFGFTLASTSFGQIDFVLVQVCRHPLYGTTPPSYCGPAAIYRPPLATAS